MWVLCQCVPCALVGLCQRVPSAHLRCACNTCAHAGCACVACADMWITIQVGLYLCGAWKNFCCSTSSQIHIAFKHRYNKIVQVGLYLCGAWKEFLLFNFLAKPHRLQTPVQRDCSGGSIPVRCMERISAVQLPRKATSPSNTGTTKLFRWVCLVLCVERIMLGQANYRATSPADTSTSNFVQVGLYLCGAWKEFLLFNFLAKPHRLQTPVQRDCSGGSIPRGSHRRCDDCSQWGVWLQCQVWNKLVNEPGRQKLYEEIYQCNWCCNIVWNRCHCKSWVCCKSWSQPIYF